MKKFILCLIIGLCFVSCNTEKKESTEDMKDVEISGNEFMILENFDGKDIEMYYDKPVEKAISMSQATTEMLLALGLSDKMVGTAFLEEPIYDSVKDEYEKVKVISDKWPSYETFMAESPDFATGWPVAFSKRGIEAEKIYNNKINIFIPESMKTTDATLDTFFNDMLMFGDIFGVKEKAEKFVNDQKEKLEKVKDELKDEKEKTVFIFDVSDDKPFTVFEGYTTNILKLINAKNVMSGQGIDKTWEATSYEAIVKADPDYIIIVEYEGNRNDSDFDAKVKLLKENDACKNLKAVKEDKILKVKLSEITPGIRTVDALVRIAEQMR